MKGDNSLLVLRSGIWTKEYVNTETDESIILASFSEASRTHKVDLCYESKTEEVKTLPLFPERKPGIELGLLTASCMNGNMRCDTLRDLDKLKQTILDQESTFREQLYELHRLHQVQRALMEQSICKDYATHGYSLPLMNASTLYSSTGHKRGEDTPKFSHVRVPKASLATELSFFGDHIYSQISQGIKCQNVSRRLFDLDHPAEDYGVAEENERIKHIEEGHCPKKHSYLFCSGAQEQVVFEQIPDLNIEGISKEGLMSHASMICPIESSHRWKELQLLPLINEERAFKGAQKMPHWLIKGDDTSWHQNLSAAVKQHEVLHMPVSEGNPLGNGERKSCWFPISPCVHLSSTSIDLSSRATMHWFQPNALSDPMEQMHQAVCSFRYPLSEVGDALRWGDNLSGRADEVLFEKAEDSKVFSGPIVTSSEAQSSMDKLCPCTKEDLQLRLETTIGGLSGLEMDYPLRAELSLKQDNYHLPASIDSKSDEAKSHASMENHQLTVSPINVSPLIVSDVNSVLKQSQSDVALLVVPKVGNMRTPLDEENDCTAQAADILSSLALDSLDTSKYTDSEALHTSNSLFDSLVSVLPQSGCYERVQEDFMQLPEDRKDDGIVLTSCSPPGILDRRKELDLFESATLMLKAVNPHSEKVSIRPVNASDNMVDCQSLQNLSRSSRRQRMGTHFRRAVLTSIVSVSRQEIADDMQVIEGLIRSTREVMQMPAMYKADEPPPKISMGSKKRHIGSRGHARGLSKTSALKRKDEPWRVFSWGEVTRRRCSRQRRNGWLCIAAGFA